MIFLLDLFAFKKKILKKFCKGSKWALGGSYRTFTIVLHKFSDTISSVIDSASQLMDRSNLITKLILI